MLASVSSFNKRTEYRRVNPRRRRAVETQKGGSLPPESVAAFVWNRWQLCRGISGNLRAEYAVNLERIRRSWNDLLRVAGSLKMGTVSASELMRSLLNTERPSTLAKAIADLGRIPKTLHLLRVIDDETYRRGILTQLNRGEGRHDLAREVFHGRRGELRQRYREGQEDQLGALGLVVNVLVLWNTVYLQAALDQLRAEGYEVKSEDVARLSPLGFKHFNFLGRYSFNLSEPVGRGKLRPLRDPSESNQLVA